MDNSHNRPNTSNMLGFTKRLWSLLKSPRSQVHKIVSSTLSGHTRSLQSLLNVTRDPVLNTLHTCVSTPSISISAEGSSFSPGRAQFHSSFSCTSTTPNLTWWLMMTRDVAWQMMVTLLDPPWPKTPKPQHNHVFYMFLYTVDLLACHFSHFEKGRMESSGDGWHKQPTSSCRRHRKAAQHHDLDLWENLSPSKSAPNRRGLKLLTQHLTWQEFLASIWG